MSYAFTLSDRLWAAGITDGDQVVRVDLITGALEVIDYSHHEIHSGSHFMYTDAVELGSAATQVYLLTTPDTTKFCHMLMDLEGSAITQFQFYEGADRDGTTLQTAGNNNRNSANLPTMAIHKGVSGGTTDGTLIHLYKGGAAQGSSRSGGQTRNDAEIILSRNTKYLLRVTSGTSANLTNVRFAWYEHTDKTAITLVPYRY